MARQTILALHKPDGLNIGINVGEVAGQTVRQLHVHVIPRYAGDVADPRGGVRHVIPGRAARRQLLSPAAGLIVAAHLPLARAGNQEIEPNELLEAHDELNFGAPGTAHKHRRSVCARDRGSGPQVADSSREGPIGQKRLPRPPSDRRSAGGSFH